MATEANRIQGTLPRRDTCPAAFASLRTRADIPKARCRRSPTKTVRIGNKGVITLPAELRREHGLEVDDIVSVVDLGDRTFILSPMVSEVVRQGDRVAEIMAEYGVSTEDILQQLDEERERYYREHYADCNRH